MNTISEALKCQPHPHHAHSRGQRPALRLGGLSSEPGKPPTSPQHARMFILLLGTGLLANVGNIFFIFHTVKITRNISKKKNQSFKKQERDFPDGPVVETLGF